MRPRQEHHKSVLVLGAGPIVIGQACEFDYAGSQAIAALKAYGCRTLLVNPNPATIMTDPNLAHRTYIEPLTWPVVEAIIAKERPDYLLPIMGGQTALNCAVDLYRHGVLEHYQVKMIGTSYEAIVAAEGRAAFRALMQKASLCVPRAFCVTSQDEAMEALSALHFPLMIRPSFTLGGDRGGMVYEKAAFRAQVEAALEASLGAPVVIEESLLGFKEFELEMVCDHEGHCIVIAGIENLDPMGVHTGDSITVTPVMTLTDKEYQAMRNDAFRAMRALGGGTVCANIQFAVCPRSGRRLVVEMNPRVSRSSALASKATGYPIAKVAAQLALGVALHEIENEATGGTISAFFEPALDYVAVKIPRFDFDKFPHTSPRLTTTMRSVGEVLGLGEHFQAALQKAIRSLEWDREGLDDLYHAHTDAYLWQALMQPTPERLWIIAELLRRGACVMLLSQHTQIDGWFIEQIRQLVVLEGRLRKRSIVTIDGPLLQYYKARGFSDKRLAALLTTSLDVIQHKRKAWGLSPSYRPVDPTAGECPSHLNFYFSGAWRGANAPSNHHAVLTSNPRVVVIGSGPNCIGQGVEFDACSVRAMQAFRSAGFETVMINCNPETVSTDYDRATRLYFEALTDEDVLEVIAFERPAFVAVQFGGRSALKLVRALDAAGVMLLGTKADAIDTAENRGKFKALVEALQLLQPPSEVVCDVLDALVVARRLGYPVLIRPSYIIGGQRMMVIRDEAALRRYHEVYPFTADRPVLVEAYLHEAIEIDVDAVWDGQDLIIAGMIEHFEPAGIHSGDSTCIWPPIRLDALIKERIEAQMNVLAQALQCVGLLNVQFALCQGELYLLEVNPRASRTVPFLSKATGVDWVEVAVKCMLGVRLSEQDICCAKPKGYAVKMPVFPFDKVAPKDRQLGPQMKATGEVMGIGRTLYEAYYKAYLARGERPYDDFVFALHRPLLGEGFLPRPLAEETKLGYTSARHASEGPFCSNVPIMDRMSVICLQDLHTR